MLASGESRRPATVPCKFYLLSAPSKSNMAPALLFALRVRTSGPPWRRQAQLHSNARPAKQKKGIGSSSFILRKVSKFASANALINCSTLRLRATCAPTVASTRGMSDDPPARSLPRPSGSEVSEPSRAPAPQAPRCSHSCAREEKMIGRPFVASAVPAWGLHSACLDLGTASL